MRVLALLTVLLATAPAFADPLRAVSSDERGVCAIDDAGAVHCNESDLTPVFEGRAIAIDRRHIVDENGVLYRWNPFASTLEERKTPFAVRDVAWSDASPCILGTKGQLACENGTGTYDVVEKSRTFVAIASGMHSLWALDKKGDLICLGRGSCAELRIAMKTSRAALWTDRAVEAAYSWGGRVERVAPWRVATNVRRLIAAGASTCVELQKSASRICWGFNAPRTVQLPAVDEAIIAANYVCSRQKDSVTCAPIGDPHPDPREVLVATVPGAIRMHGGKAKLCVEARGGQLWCTPGSTYSFSKFGPITWAKPKAVKR